MIVRPLLIVALVVALLACLAGCGGSSSSSSASSTAATASGADRAAYVKEADAVCQATDEVTATLSEELTAAAKSGNLSGPRGERELGELLARNAFIGREEAKELAAIRPPAADAATIKHWIDTGEEGLDGLEAAALALEEGSSAKFGPLYEEGLATLKRAHAIARDYGFKVCGAEGTIQTIK